MSGSPPITVLMPVRDQARYVRAALDSVVEQTFADYEFLIVDDHSSDETPSILADYARREPRIRVMRNEAPLGVAGSLNRGLALARGRYIARMDADDLCLPRRFERQFEVLEASPEIGVLGCRTLFIDEDGVLSPQAPWLQPTSSAVIAWQLLYSCPLCHPSTMLRAERVHAVGGYRQEYPTEDMDLWTRMVFQTRVANLDETLLHYRMPPALHRKKARAWRPHELLVGREYAERILGRSVDADSIELLFDFHRLRGLDPRTDVFDVFRLCSLLRDLVSAMPSRLSFAPAERAELEALVIAQSQRLIAETYDTLEAAS